MNAIPSGDATNHDNLDAGVFAAALTAAFPGLPPCMTLDEAGRRIAAALNAAQPMIEQRLREKIAAEIREQEKP